VRATRLSRRPSWCWPTNRICRTPCRAKRCTGETGSAAKRMTGRWPSPLVGDESSPKPSEGLLVSEDVRCFFYILAKPPRIGCCTWHLTGPCLTLFDPAILWNPVGIAQHVHRVLVKRSCPQSGTFSVGNLRKMPLFRSLTLCGGWILTIMIF